MLQSPHRRRNLQSSRCGWQHVCSRHVGDARAAISNLYQSDHGSSCPARSSRRHHQRCFGDGVQNVSAVHASSTSIRLSGRDPSSTIDTKRNLPLLKSPLRGHTLWNVEVEHFIRAHSKLHLCSSDCILTYARAILIYDVVHRKVLVDKDPSSAVWRPAALEVHHYPTGVLTRGPCVAPPVTFISAFSRCGSKLLRLC